MKQAMYDPMCAEEREEVWKRRPTGAGETEFQQTWLNGRGEERLAKATPFMGMSHSTIYGHTWTKKERSLSNDGRVGVERRRVPLGSAYMVWKWEKGFITTPYMDGKMERGSETAPHLRGKEGCFRKYAL